VLKTRQGNISPQGIYISLEFDEHHQENYNFLGGSILALKKNS
jgi:hypothetical protein